jgi:hypothetical protein
MKRNLMRMQYVEPPKGVIVTGHIPLTEAEVRDAMAHVRRDLTDYFTSKYSSGGWKFDPEMIEYSLPPTTRTVIGLVQIERD